MDEDSEHKKAKGTKKCVIKRKLMFKNYKDCRFNNKIILQSQKRFKSDYHNVCTKQINKIALNSNNDKRIQTLKKNIDEYNTDKERKILISFDDMIADMINNKKLISVITKLFIRGRKLNISLVFITQSYFKVPKDVRLSSTHIFIMKIPNKRELQKIALNHSSDISSKDFIKICKKYTAEPDSFLVNDATLASDNPLRFRKNIFNI